YFKTKVDDLLQRAKTYGVGLHITLSYGISREVQLYNSAKNEDIRSAQWYNDNNMISEAQWNVIKKLPVQANEVPRDDGWVFNHNNIDGFIKGSDTENYVKEAGNGLVGQYALTTMSRYARKLRRHLEAKARAAFAYLTLKQQQNPDLLLVVSSPGEAEMNLHPVNHFPYLVEYFCDFSPFAVLEFRDWIQHEGLYADNKKYSGEGYVNGGSRYQGDEGLQHFNDDFQTSFITWDLKYYHWTLDDPVDMNYTDNTDPDPNAIHYTAYTFNGMMPVGGAHFIDRGFDPPRLMLQKGENSFWDLWQLFRETMVYHYVKDMAAIARASGFAKNHYYTHQIPGDYLFGTRPNDPDNPFLNPRYYSSASPLWTANAYSDTGMGITMYDINFGTWYARTSQYLLPVISSLSTNWGAMEYNPEIIPQGPEFNIEMASTQSIYEQIMKLYNHNVHFIGFFKWLSTMEHQFKGTNREGAIKLFFDTVKDKARQSTDTVFTPKSVENFAGMYYFTNDFVDLTWSKYIWSNLKHTWTDWGDFKEFVIYRGYTENFLCNSITQIARVRTFSYKDSRPGDAPVIYYKIAAVNSDGIESTAVRIGVMTGKVGGTPSLNISRDGINFGAAVDGPVTPPQTFTVANTGKGVLSWTVIANATWLNIYPPGGFDSGMVTVSANAAGLTAGTYTSTITIGDPNAVGSPKTIQVSLNVYAAGKDAAPFGSFETPP
ncbi:MAG TPA: BACON domain-containing protein, partial [Candidatus Deferrimicrobium sp.]|nr:BACON domain-containing protein [Candidatus Deferrimicrobium sp.]